MQAERGLETGMRQIKLARDQQRAPQFQDRCLRRQMRPFVEPLCDQELGVARDRFAVIFPWPSISISTRTNICGVALMMTTARTGNGRAT
jgi:hypothetical protein